MEENYSYPLDIDWKPEEMVVVMDMWQAVEAAYEQGIPASEFLETHRQFKKVIKSIGEERQLGREFEGVSGYSLYHALQDAKKAPDKLLKMKGA